MKQIIILYFLFLFCSTSFSQSPSRRYTYTTDSIKYKANQSDSEGQSMPTSPMLDFVSIDYSINRVTVFGNPTNKERVFTIEAIKQPEEDKDVETNFFLCKDKDSVMCNVHLLLPKDDVDHPVMLIKYKNGRSWVYYLRRF